MVIKSLIALMIVFFLAIILAPSISLATQYGNLKVKVVDCSSNNPISNAKVCVQIITDPCEYTNSNGEVLFQNLVIDDYSIHVSKDGYNSDSVTARVECSKITEITVCLSKIKVCNPGEIRNRRCTHSTQVAYERCKEDGSGWETVIENCPNGYYCDNGFCKPVQKKCNVKIWIKEENTNLPIMNAKVCFNGKCYLTDSNGLVSFHVNVGSYNVQISKEDYIAKSITISCQDCENPVHQTVTLQKIKTCFDCNLLDGWYYTTESYCELKGFECGRGILLRKEEYRDYYGICVDSSSQCKNYKVVGYRWVDGGICEKKCSSGTCEEGFCKQSVKLEEMKLSSTYQEYEHPKQEEVKINLVAFILIFTIFFLSIFLFTKKKRVKEETF